MITATLVLNANKMNGCVGCEVVGSNDERTWIGNYQLPLSKCPRARAAWVTKGMAGQCPKIEFGLGCQIGKLSTKKREREWRTQRWLD